MATSKAARGVREAASAGRHFTPVYLLDVNVLLALLDPMHAFHAAAHRWFRPADGLRWATCPLTENAVVRIASQPGYPNSPGGASIVAGKLSVLCALTGHSFWPDSLSVLDASCFVREKLLSRHLTDTYLLALAVKHGGKLASFDRRLIADAVHGGKAALHVIEG